LYQIGLRVFILARVVALIEQPNVSEAVPAPLTVQERVRLGQLIRTVERGLSQFLAVGAALLELRSSRLYIGRPTIPLRVSAAKRSVWRVPQLIK
jgi:hypothetical protein